MFINSIWLTKRSLSRRLGKNQDIAGFCEHLSHLKLQILSQRCENVNVPVALVGKLWFFKAMPLFIFLHGNFEPRIENTAKNQSFGQFLRNFHHFQ